MKAFIELFTDARAVSTPIIAVRTFDAASTIRTVSKSLGEDIDKTPLIAWDSIHGLKGINDSGETAINTMCSDAGAERGATVDAAIALGVLESAKEDVISFFHNSQLTWMQDPKVIQGVWNLRDGYKANGNMLVLMIGAGDILPTELQQDIMMLDEPLPTREELAKIVRDTFLYASQSAKYKACKDAATDAVVNYACDALVGLPAFPAEQAVAVCLNKLTGELDIEMLWARKRSIISQLPGVTFHQGKETLADMYGVASFKKFAVKLLGGNHAPTLILRMDEIEKQLAGSATDSSGVKGDMMGEFLTWVQDNGVICTLLLGVPGSSKSWATYCIGGEYKKPVINYNLAAMQDMHVGNSGKNQRQAQRSLDSISDGKIWLIATANSLNGLPPELISRFQVGGIFFFDAPDAEERAGIMKLKLAKYKLDAGQELPDMTGWTGRDIENCARKADLLGVTVKEAGQYVVPLMKSHHEQMDALRQSAHDRFLSASNDGVYQYTTLEADEVSAPAPATKVINGRKMR